MTACIVSLPDLRISCHMVSIPCQIVWILRGKETDVLGGIWASHSRPLILPVYPLTSCTNRPASESDNSE